MDFSGAFAKSPVKARLFPCGFCPAAAKKFAAAGGGCWRQAKIENTKIQLHGKN
jgi:hypothetical protein